jgi:DNA-binding beta-propeller fold protein YncE
MSYITPAIGFHEKAVIHTFIHTLAIAVMLLLAAMTTACANETHFPEGAPWLNVSRALTQKDLHGRVVLLDFFTPGCINCIHILPETAKLEHEFGRRLLIIGVDSPKFTASQERANLEGFVQRYAIQHPIVIDKHMRLWQHFSVFAWPTQVLLGPDGKVVGQYVGEGKYADIRHDVIQTLATARKAGKLTNVALPLKPMVHTTQGLLQPGKLAVNAKYVAVSDSGHNRVILLDHHGRVISVIGDGKRGARDGPANQAQFDGPQGLAFRGENLYVADTGNALIRTIALPAKTVSTLAGNGKHDFGISGWQAARAVGLNSPWALQVVGDTLYIAMAGVHQIWQMDLQRDRIGPFAGSGAEGIDDGPLTLASFAQSSALAYHAGELYVADPEASAVRRITLSSDQVQTLIGQGLFTFGLRNGPAKQALLQHDQGLAWLNKRLYIADTFNNAIRVLDLRTNEVSTLATNLAQPGGLAVLNAGTLLVADTNANRIATIDVHTGKVSAWQVTGL